MIIIIIVYYQYQSNIYETLQTGESSTETPTESKHESKPESDKTKQKEKEFRTFLYDFKMTYLRKDRIDAITNMRNIVRKITLCQNEKNIKIESCLKPDEYTIYQEIQENILTRGKLYKELLEQYKTNNELPTDTAIPIILNHY